MAKKFDLKLSADVERFFAAAEAGRWEELKTLFEDFKQRVHSDEPAEDLRKVWPAIFETFCTAEVASEWPAQKLLDYGQSVLGALRPGMVYVGGTDAGRYIPTLLNETSGGEPHIIITQNALADGSYLNYLGFLYGDRMATLQPSSRAAGAVRRARSDRVVPVRRPGAVTTGDLPRRHPPAHRGRDVDGGLRRLLARPRVPRRAGAASTR